MGNFIKEINTNDLLILAILFISLLSFYRKKLYFRLILHPYAQVRGKDLYRVVTSAFVHNDRIHLLTNLAVLYIFGGYLEEKADEGAFLDGSTVLIIIFLSGLLTANIFTVILYRNRITFSSAGRSGAVLGVMGCFILIDPLGYLINFPFVPSLANFYWVMIYTAGLIYLSYKRRFDKVNYGAHLFGLLGGLIAGFLLFGKQIL